VTANIRTLIESLGAIGPGVRVGIVAYKDLCDREMIRSLPLTQLDPGGIAALNSFVASMTASGGCDWPEKMDAAIDAAGGMAWRGDVPSSLVVIADAPAHPQDEQAVISMVTAFRTNLPQGQVSLIDTGSGGHKFMRAVPLAGGGQYVTYNGQILNSLLPAITGCKSS
jgi:hypothetical protein